MPQAKIAVNFIPNCTVPAWFKERTLTNGTVLARLINISTTHKSFEGAFWVNNPQIRFGDYINGM